MPIFQYKPLRYEILKHRDSPSLTCLELLIRANYPDRGGYLSTMKLEEFRFELSEELIAYLFYACPIERASVFLLHLLHSNKRKMKVMQPVPGKCHPCLRYNLLPICPVWTHPKWSGCGDLNPGPLRPERSALANCATPRRE